MINVSGNFGFLGLLTLVQSFPLLEDSFYQLFFPVEAISKDENFPAHWLIVIVSWLVVIPYLCISLVPLVSTFRRKIPWKQEIITHLSSTKYAKVNEYTIKIDTKLTNTFSFLESSSFTRQYLYVLWRWLQLANEYVSPFSIINRYAKFGSMTTNRIELVFQGSNDGEEWTEYVFKYKPGPVSRSPPVIPLHLPGLDWRLWFLGPSVRKYGLSSLPNWYFSFVECLLEGRKEVLELMANNPFPHVPPKYIRTVLYEYTFSNAKGCHSSKLQERITNLDSWWIRDFIGTCGSPRALQVSS